MTEVIGRNSGEIQVRLLRLSPMSSGVYGCEVQTRDAVNTYGYPSLKEMIVRDPTSNVAHKVSKNSAIAVIVCAMISLIHAARANHY